MVYTTGKDAHVTTAQALTADAPCHWFLCMPGTSHPVRAFMTLSQLLVQQHKHLPVMLQALLQVLCPVASI